MLQVKFDITTDASGDYDSTDDATTCPQANISDNRMGPLLLYAVEMVIGTLTSGAADVTLSMTDTLSGVDKTLLTLTNISANAWHYPQVLGSDNTGTALTGWYMKQVVEGTLKVVVASGGNVKTGTLIAYLQEDEC